MAGDNALSAIFLPNIPAAAFLPNPERPAPATAPIGPRKYPSAAVATGAKVFFKNAPTPPSSFSTCWPGGIKPRPVAERTTTHDIAFPRYRSSSGHLLRMACSIQPRTGSIAVNHTGLAAPICQSCPRRPRNNDSVQFQRSLKLWPPLESPTFGSVTSVSHAAPTATAHRTAESVLR